MTDIVHPDSASILAALPLRPRPQLYVTAAEDESGHPLILESATPEALAEGDDSEGIIGLAIHDESGWYLGCIECRAEIEETDSGMCRDCRKDEEAQDSERLAWQEAQAGPWDHEGY